MPMRQWLAAAAFAVAASVSSMGVLAQTPIWDAATPTPFLNPTPWATPPSYSTGNGQLDIDSILPPGEGRDLVMWKCTVCHRYGIITHGQRTVARWEAIKWSHQGKMLVTPSQLDTMFSYLEQNFNPDKPEPVLPSWFMSEEDSPEW